MNKQNSKLRQTECFLLLLLLLVSSALYFPVFNFEILNYDDGSFVYNSFVRNFQVHELFLKFFSFDYIPLALTSLSFDQLLFGLSAKAIHGINLGYHLLNIILLWFVLTKFGFSTFTKSMVLIVFALHPAQIESVAWISERKGLLAMTLLLASVLVYPFMQFKRVELFEQHLQEASSLNSNKLKVKGSSTRLKTFAAGFLLILSLLAKPVGLGWILFFLIFRSVEVINASKTVLVKGFKKLELVFLSATLVFFALLHMKARNSFDATQESYQWGTRFKQFADSLGFTFAELSGHGYYVPFLSQAGWGKVIWEQPQTIVAALFVLCILIWHLVTKNKLGIWGVVFFVCLLLPQTKLVPFGLSFEFADRYLYIAILGIALSTALIIDHYAKSLNRQSRYVKMCAFLGIAFVLNPLEWRARLLKWQSSEKVWASVVDFNPNLAIAWNNMGLGHLEKKSFIEAKKAFYGALKADSEYYKAFVNLAFIDVQEGDFDSSLRHLQRAQYLVPEDFEIKESIGKIQKMCSEKPEACVYRSQLNIPIALSASKQRFEHSINENLMRTYYAELTEIKDKEITLGIKNKDDAVKFESQEMALRNQKALQNFKENSRKVESSPVQFLTKEQARSILDSVQTHPVVRVSEIAKYDAGSEIGFCFGRAMYIHLELLRRGIKPESLSKIFIIGNLHYYGDNWDFHVAVIVRGPKDTHWVVDDVAGEILTVQEWMKKSQQQMSVNKKHPRVRFYFTDAVKFQPELGGYNETDLSLPIFKGYFTDLLQWFAAHP